MTYKEAKSAAFKYKVANNKDRVKNSDGKYEYRYVTDLDIAARPCVKRVNNYEGGFDMVIRSFEYEDTAKKHETLIHRMNTCRGLLAVFMNHKSKRYEFFHNGELKHSLSEPHTNEARLSAHWLGFIEGIVR